jgi:DNA-binding CsgD family transcriptional regulator/sugar-specific transcriptional regulator TrmB
MLQELGLSSTAGVVYQAMFAEPSCGIDDLCEYLGLDEQVVRSCLDELVKFALLRESRDQPGQLRVVPPQVGLETLLKQQEDDLARRQLELTATKAQVAELVSEYSRLRPDISVGGTRRLAGLDAIQSELEILAAELESECLSVMPGGAQSGGSLRASQPLDQRAIERGVSLLTLYQDSARNDPATYAYAQWLTDLGGQVRTAPVLPPRMLIFDRQIAMVPLDPSNSRIGALCTSEPGLVVSLTSVFEQAWNTAIPLGAHIAVDETTGLSTVDRELLRLLASGMTDEAAGRRLGVSSRTVRRQMAALMEQLNAASRFEAGLKAAQRGWL